jgi:hypothetical protein
MRHRIALALTVIGAIALPVVMAGTVLYASNAAIGDAGEPLSPEFGTPPAATIIHTPGTHQQGTTDDHGGATTGGDDHGGSTGSGSSGGSGGSSGGSGSSDGGSGSGSSGSGSSGGSGTSGGGSSHGGDDSSGGGGDD